ncbi:MAG: hypothetical protein ACLFU0_11140, partial [Alphaproteobacteria bacterium]
GDQRHLAGEPAGAEIARRGCGGDVAGAPASRRPLDVEPVPPRRVVLEIITAGHRRAGNRHHVDRRE